MGKTLSACALGFLFVLTCSPFLPLDARAQTQPPAASFERVRYCPQSSDRAVSDPEVRQCEERRTLLDGPLRRQVREANQRFQEVAAARTSLVRSQNQGTECRQIIQTLTSSNEAGTATMQQAILSLERLRNMLIGQRRFFENQVNKLRGPRNPSTIFMTPPPDAAARIPRMAQEFYDGIDKEIKPSLEVVEASMAAGIASQQELGRMNESLSTQSANCSSLANVAIGGESGRPAGASPDQVAALNRQTNPQAYNGRADAMPLDAGGGGTMRATPFSAENSYVDQNGNRLFVSQQTTSNGSTIYWAVRQDANGNQSALPIGPEEYATLSQRLQTQFEPSGDLDRYLGYFSDNRSAAVRISGAALQPGESGIYGSGYTMGSEISVGGAPLSPEEIAARQQFRGSLGLGGSGGAGTAVVAGAAGEIRSADGRSLTAQQVAAVIARSPGGGTNLTEEQRQSIAQELVRQASVRGGTFEQQQEYVASRLARIQTESNFNPSISSRAGAQGIAQIMPSTAEWLATTTEGRAALQGTTPQACLQDAVCSLRLGMVYDQRHAAYSQANPYLAPVYYLCGGGGCQSTSGGAVAAARTYSPTDAGWVQAIGGASPTVRNYTLGNYYYTSQYMQALGGSSLPLAGSIQRSGPGVFTVGRGVAGA